MPVKYFESTGCEVELKDTTSLQLASLEKFAKGMGYKWVQSLGCFVAIPKYLDLARKNGITKLSLRTVQDYHNESKGIYYLVSLLKDYPVRTCLELRDNKLVETSHLQYSKKLRKILCTNHQIKFA